MELALLVMVALMLGIAAVRVINAQRHGQGQTGKPQLAYYQPRGANRSVWLKHW